VDMPDGKQLEKVLEDLAASRSEYARELSELKDSMDSEEGSPEGAPTEEPFRIQAVRVATSTSRIPSQPVGVGSAFNTAWKEAGYAPIFLLELETKRIAAVKAANVKNLCQNIAYEDVKFQELPETFVVSRALADPELSLYRELRRLLTTFTGALAAFLALAVVTAVAPELPLMLNAISLGSVLTLLVICWPVACRRCLSMFWIGA